MGFLEFLLFLSPILICAVLLWCFGRYVVQCHGKWKCLFMSVGIAAASFTLFWMVFFLLNTVSGSFTIDLIGPVLACLLFTWMLIHEFYKGQDGNRISVSTGFVVAFVYAFVQGISTVGFGVELGVIMLT